MIRCAISLGGNLGDVAATFDRACRSLVAHSRIANFSVSRQYRTAPMGADAGAEFLNAAAAFETSLDPEPLLDVLQQIEHDCGRGRTLHWGPRTLDLDLLLYGEHTINIPSSHPQSPPSATAGPARLIVPHPALWHRRFVLDPLCEVMPDAIHPAFGMTMAEVRARLLPRPLPVSFCGKHLQSVAQTFLSVRTDRNVCATEKGTDAAIVFASRGDNVLWPHVVRLPEKKAAAIQLVKDVLTASLDEPLIVD